jgi:hypothetical protein
MSLRKVSSRGITELEIAYLSSLLDEMRALLKEIDDLISQET